MGVEVVEVVERDRLGGHRELDGAELGGAVVADVYNAYLGDGYDIRPTIAVTKAHIHLPEIRDAIAAGRLAAHGRIPLTHGSALVAQAAIAPGRWPAGGAG